MKGPFLSHKPLIWRAMTALPLSMAFYTSSAASQVITDGSVGPGVTLIDGCRDLQFGTTGNLPPAAIAGLAAAGRVEHSAIENDPAVRGQGNNLRLIGCQVGVLAKQFFGRSHASDPSDKNVRHRHGVRLQPCRDGQALAPQEDRIEEFV